MEYQVILFPDYEKLTKKIKKLKKELCNLLNERDELTFVICRNIESEYMVKLGSLEIALFKVQCKVLRLKRKLAMIQQRLNRREHIDVQAIESELDVEFEEYQKKLGEQVDRLNEAIRRRKGEFLTEAETKEVKKLYYKIVKNIHPDLNPNAGAAEWDLLYSAMEAYKNGDLETLRIIEKTFVDEEGFVPNENGLRAMEEEKHWLEALIQGVEDEIRQIKESFPYNVRPILEDTEALEEKRCEYEHAIELEQSIYESYQERLASIMER